MSTPSTSELQRALRVQEQIEKLEAELRKIMSGWEVGNGKKKSASSSSVAAAAVSVAAKPAMKKKRRMSPEARARIVAAQKARWAKFRKDKQK